MSATIAAYKVPSETNPLEQLSQAMSEDMAKTNQVIIDQMQSDVPLIPQLAGYLIAAGGKRIRHLLTLACTRLFSANSTRCYGLAAAVEFVHTATLLHDDVVDESEERRGQATANDIFGNQASVLVGDFLFARSFQLMVADGSLDVLRVLSNAAAFIVEGEVLQLSIQSQMSVTMAQYSKVIEAKTASLFAAATEVGAWVSDRPDMAKAMHDYGYHLGMAFQIVDDLLDYLADAEKLGKNKGDDFREGKFTAPLILALQNANEDERAFWLRTMVERKQTDGDFEQAVEICERHNAFTQSRELAIGHAQLAAQALDACPDSELKHLLQALPAFVLSREN